MSEARIALPTSGQSVRRALAASPRFFAGLVALAASLCATAAGASEAELKIPDLGSVNFVGMSGHNLLLFGLIICVGGMVFGLVQFMQHPQAPGPQGHARDLGAHLRDLQDLPDHPGQVPRILWAFIAVIIVVYFGVLLHFSADRGAHHPALQPRRHRWAATAWPGSASASTPSPTPARPSPACRGKPFPTYAIPLQVRHEHRHAADQRRAGHHALHPALHPGRLGRPLLHRLRHRRVAGRRGAAHRRRHLHQDRRHRLRPDEDRLQDQGRRRPQPRRHRRLHGRQRGRLGRPHRRRLRDLRRHRRGAHHLHPPGGERPDRPGPAPGLDLRRCAS